MAQSQTKVKVVQKFTGLKDRSPPITIVEHQSIEAVAAMQLHVPSESLLIVTECVSDERYGKQAGQISIPMGKIEEIELNSADIKQAVLRELWQETGITGEIQAYIGRFGIEVDGIETAVVTAYLMKPFYDTLPIFLMNTDKTVKDPRFMAIKDFLALCEQVRPSALEIVGRGLQILKERLDIEFI